MTDLEDLKHEIQLRGWSFSTHWHASESPYSTKKWTAFVHPLCGGNDFSYSVLGNSPDCLTEFESLDSAFKVAQRRMEECLQSSKIPPKLETTDDGTE